jgi:uncharacterized protein (TIGR02246 family)
MVQQAVRSKIEDTNAQFMAAIGRGDTAGVAALYTEDALLMAPGAPAAKGKSAIQALLDGMVAQMGVPQLTLKTQQVEEIGDTAIEVGAYTLEAGPVTDNGKYVVIWKRQGDDSWQLAVDIWNSDSPPPGA